MSKGKPRWYPDKPQNNRQISCPRYEEYSNGICYCEQGSSDDAKIVNEIRIIVLKQSIIEPQAEVINR